MAGFGHQRELVAARSRRFQGVLYLGVAGLHTRGDRFDLGGGVADRPSRIAGFAILGIPEIIFE